MVLCYIAIEASVVGEDSPMIYEDSDAACPLALFQESAKYDTIY